MAMTLTEIRQQALDELYSARIAERPLVHQINGAIDGSTPTVVVDDGTLVTGGNIIEFADGEQCLVESVATNTLTVKRGWNNTTGAAHSDNATFNIDPRFTINETDKLISRLLKQLDGYGIFQLATGSDTLVAGTDFYNPALTDVFQEQGVLAVYYWQSQTSVPMALPFKWISGMDTAGSLGEGILLFNWGELKSGDTIYLTFAQSLSNQTSVPDSVGEILVLGTVARSLIDTMGPRTHDPGKLTDRTVQPGQGGRDSLHYQREYQRALWRERARLMVVAQRLPGSVMTKRARRFVS